MFLSDIEFLIPYHTNFLDYAELGCSFQLAPQCSVLVIKMPKTRATPKGRARDRATPTSAESSSKLALFAAEDQQEAGRVGSGCCGWRIRRGRRSNFRYTR